MKRPQHILVTPLDWGLGHATRCIPIIRELLNQGCKVSIAGSGLSIRILQEEFPTLVCFPLSSYRVKYSKHAPFLLHMIFRLPIMIHAIRREHRQVEKIIEENHIDGVISDNRYGCWSSSIKTAFISHQLSIQMPYYLKWATTLINKMQQKAIVRFTEVWTPDDPAHSLAGDLGKYLGDRKYIGILSRFNNAANSTIQPGKILVLISGPEPQRSLFESICLQQLLSSNSSATVVQGLPENIETQTKDNVFIYPHLHSQELIKLIVESEYIICRFGYSSLMDLATLHKSKMIVVPTPGQTEQEYLAERLYEMKMVVRQKQDRFNLTEALQEADKLNGFVSWNTTSNLLPQTIHEWLHR